MSVAQSFPYLQRDASAGNAGLAPMLPLTLIGSKTVSTSGLLDSGAALNVLPFAIGAQLGFNWDQQTRSLELTGNLATVEARIVVVSAIVGSLPPVRLACAWAQTDTIICDSGASELLHGVRCLFPALPQSLRD